ncbi:hypothetical protein DDZ16_06040 [Marinilabilia rubra]|uniref:Uncharacterized protein n=1 Tax=Marinilabilia rubra TaxID=2162893 RepID=A0A2U2BBS7_9BACT|nr:hypothetical protein DDZ16_06040 [Marinilabilia rubra]
MQFVFRLEFRVVFSCIETGILKEKGEIFEKDRMHGREGIEPGVLGLKAQIILAQRHRLGFMNKGWIFFAL